MDDKQVEERLAREDEVWTGPRFVGLLGVTLAIALTVIYFIASVRSGDFRWSPFANNNPTDARPADW